MSIDEIKDISKLRTMLKNALGELEYIKGCCINAGKELEKHSFAWDGKEKNLVVQAAELNKKYKQSKQAFEKIEEVIKNLEKENICTFPDLDLKTNTNLIIKQCNRGYVEILDIINEVKNE